MIGGGTGLMNLYTGDRRFCRSLCLSFEPGEPCVELPTPVRVRDNYLNRIVIGEQGELFVFGNPRAGGKAELQILTPIPD